ncbi:Ger(x)C family spore germination protein [Bacillus sp. JJ722]|uniref:Ger(x)C family spore germination protein n=1 Tax=Bacillus sp. JJ722 TaxID=3122973 RepID=UPI002FFEFA62
MKENKVFILLCLLTIVCSGCWDQRLLKERGIVLIIGLDIDKENYVTETVAFPISMMGSMNQESIIASDKGVTTRNARENMDKKVSEVLDFSKTRTFLFGEKVAKKSILPVMDTFYSESKSPLNARVAIVKGTAEEALSITAPEKPLISDYYYGLIESAVMIGDLPNVNVQETSSDLSTPEKDILIPLIEVMKEKNRAKVIGLALFDQDKMVGELSTKETKMYLLLNDSHKKKRTFTLKVKETKKNNQKNYVNFNVLDTKRKLRVIEKNGNISAHIDLHLDLGVNEYPLDHLNRKKVIDDLTHNIEKQLTKVAERTIKKLQKANCDGLAIGLRVKAFHNKIWEKSEWKEMYRDIPITVHISTKIIEHGTTK